MNKKIRGINIFKLHPLEIVNSCYIISVLITILMVTEKGLEPPRPKATDFESLAFTNSEMMTVFQKMFEFCLGTWGKS